MRTGTVSSNFIAFVLVAAVSSCDGSDRSAAPAPTGSRADQLAEEERIEVDAYVGGKWVTIHPTTDGFRDVAKTICRHEVQNDPATPCTIQDVKLPTLTGVSANTFTGDTEKCKDATCYARAENCVGAMFEEIAHSPVPRELPNAAEATGFTADDLSLPEEETGLLTEAVGRFRLRAATAATRATAERAALMHYHEAAYTAWLMSPENPTGCQDFLNSQPAPGSPLPKWIDLFAGTFVDAAEKFDELIRSSGAETRSVAISKGRGTKTPAVAAKQRWNAGPNSVAAVGRLFARGNPSSSTPTEPPEYADSRDFARHFNPSRLPSCPPVRGRGGVTRAIESARRMGVSPKQVGGAESFGTLLAKAHTEDKALAKGTVPANTEDALRELRFTEEDASLAAEYLNREAAMFARTHTPRANQPAGAAIHVTRYHGLHKPTRLPSGTVASHLAGNLDDVTSLSINTEDYGRAGAIRALDQMKRTAYHLQSATYAFDAKPAVGSLMATLETDVGDERVSFQFGPPDGDFVETATITIYGSDPGANYFVMQGIPALKCFTEHTIDGAPCPELSALAKPVTGPLTANATIAFDLPRKQYIELQTSTLKRAVPGSVNPTYEEGKVNTSESLFVVKKTSSGTSVVAATVPKASGSMLMPAGGLLQKEFENLVQADPDDCSDTAESCVDLPMNIVPPLESELFGDQASQTYEDSWRHYLEIARAAADEADGLGNELLRTGLDIDRYASDAQEQVMDQCGADGLGCKDVVEHFVNVGTSPGCIWFRNNELCGALGDLGISSLECPLFKEDGEQKSCEELITQRTGLQFPVQNMTVHDVLPLGMGTTEEPAAEPSPSCALINRLRNGIADQAEREAAILQLSRQFPREIVSDIASSLKYTEEFADNYTLTMGGGAQPLFQTQRPTRPGDPANAFAPCVIGTTTDDDSEFWTQSIDCYANPGLGTDGDLTEDFAQNFSLDTEPDALKNRWAWGFGHLRRSVVALRAQGHDALHTRWHGLHEG